MKKDIYNSCYSPGEWSGKCAKLVYLIISDFIPDERYA